jgi:hypothetical protein
MDVKFFALCKEGKTIEAAELLDQGAVSVHAEDKNNVRYHSAT